MPYNRLLALEYARKWALSRNRAYYNFDKLGGDCTNFASQCIFAGSGVMNYTKTFGWYYISLDQRAPSWTGVEFFYNFITQNKGVGPFGREARIDELEIGDVIQLGRNADGFYHTLIVVGFDGDDPLIAAQTNDAYMRPLSTYSYDFARYIKILGVRYITDDDYSCYDKIINAPSVPNPPVGEGQ